MINNPWSEWKSFRGQGKEGILVLKIKSGLIIMKFEGLLERQDSVYLQKERSWLERSTIREKSCEEYRNPGKDLPKCTCRTVQIMMVSEANWSSETNPSTWLGKRDLGFMPGHMAQRRSEILRSSSCKNKQKPSSPAWLSAWLAVQSPILSHHGQHNKFFHLTFRPSFRGLFQ